MSILHDARVAEDILIFAYRQESWRRESKLEGLAVVARACPFLVLAALVANEMDEVEVSPESLDDNGGATGTAQAEEGER